MGDGFFITFGKRVLLGFAFSLLASLCSFALAGTNPPMKEGVLDLRQWLPEDDELVRVEGEAIFYWQQFDVSAQERQNPRFISIPAFWNSSNSYPKFGYGSYLVRILVDPSRVLQFHLNSAWSSSRVYLDGVLITQRGEPGRDPASTTMELDTPRLITYQPKGPEVELVVEAANFEMQFGGGLTITLGKVTSVQNFQLRWISYNLVVLGALFIMGLYHLTLFSLRPKDRSTLAFGLFCLFMSSYLYSGSLSGFLRPILPIHSKLSILVFNISWKLSIAFFLWFASCLYPKEISRTVALGLMGIASLFVITAMIIPMALYIQIIPVFQIITAAGLIYTLYGVSRAFRLKRYGIKTFAAFLMVLSLAAINDMVMTLGVIRSFPLGPGATLLFVLGQSYLLSTRFARAFQTAEHLTANLQSEVENQTKTLTEQKEILEKQAEQLASTHRELQDLDALKTSFFRQVSHELRTPLTLIIGSLNQAVKTSQFQEGIGIAQKNAKRLLRLVNQLLDFQRLQQNREAMRTTAVQLRPLVTGVCDHFRSTCADRQIQFIFHDQVPLENPVTVAGQADNVETILFNYLSNALKYTPKNGAITVYLEEEKGFYRVRVQDSGCGIAPDQIDKLFRVFVRLQDHDQLLREGTGIGLALCKDLATAMQGRVGVNSEVGHGSSFWVELPRTSALTNPDLNPIVDILFVDDEEDICASFAKGLAQFTQIESFRMAESFEQALALMNTHRFRCIISDINLRNSTNNGVDLLIYAAKTQPLSIRVIWSGERSGELMQKAINEARVESVIFKPCRFSVELPKIEELLSKSTLQAVLPRNKESLEQRASIHIADIKAVEPVETFSPQALLPDRPTLIITDDIPDLRHMIRNILSGKNYNFIECGDGSEALEYLTKASHPIDLVITDWMMPRMSGPELIEAILKDQRLSSIPTVLLTAKSDDQSRSWAIQHGASAYLSKPFDELELISTVENLLNLKRQERRVAELNRYITVNVLQRFLPSSLVQSIIEGRSTLDDEPQTRSVTVLFADLCAFTSNTEKLGPRKIADILNAFLTSMTEIIFDYKGTIDKFLGDGILVVFGAPESMSPEEQVKQARDCSIAMQNQIKILNEQWASHGYPPFQMRIGLHYGPAVIGSFGGPKRSDYTVIGHTVNLASRIQGLAEPGTIYFSQTIRDLLPDNNWEDKGQFKIKGIEQEMTLFSVMLQSRSDAA